MITIWKGTFKKIKEWKWTYLLVFLLFWFGVLSVTGTMFSGFHFTDDHDVIRIQQELSKTTLSKEIHLFTHDIFSSELRFRPFYLLHRRAATAILGTNFLAWSIYTGLLAAFTSFFFFLFMRESKYSIIESLVFTGLALLGPQAAIWWKLGANETLGIFILAIAMLFMARSVYRPHHKRLYNLLFVFFTLLASWSKESFILMIPALIVWQGGLAFRKALMEDRAKGVSHPLIPSLWRAVKLNLGYSIVLVLIFVAEMAHILFKVGTTGIGYAGYAGFTVNGFFHTLLQSILSLHGWIPVLLFILIIVLFILIPRKDDFRLKSIFSLYPILRFFILGGLIIIPQVLLYMKSGISERYLLPAALGYALITAAFLRHIRLHYRPSIDTKPKTTKIVEIVILAIISLTLLQQLRVMRYTAIAFTQDGKYTNQWFQSIQLNTGESTPILVVTHPIRYLEPSVSLHTYLSIALNRRHLLFVPPSTMVKNSGFWKNLNQTFFSQNPDAKEVVFPSIIIFPGLEKDFLQQAPKWFNPSQYRRYSNNEGYTGYYVKEEAKISKDIESHRG